MTVFALYMILVNLTSFALCSYDKYLALRGMRRISERALFFPAILGGPFGLLLGMYGFRHKTRRLKFTVLVPILCIVWLGFSVLLYRYTNNL